MTDILVRPQELRQTAQQLRASAKKISGATGDVGKIVLGSALRLVFTGNRASALMKRYLSKAGELAAFDDLVLKFANDLEQIANKFEQADKAGSTPGRDVDQDKKSPKHKKTSAQFNKEWEKMSIQERIDYLDVVYEKIIIEYGLERVMLSIEDLPDRMFLWINISDARGMYSGDRIAIDSDNLHNDKGSELLKTFVHEIRHQIQHKLVTDYRENGEQISLPSGVSIEQVKAWSDNFDNYIKPDDDYEGYRKQPLEKDSRDFSDKYTQDYYTI